MITFHQHAWEDYLYWQSQDKKTLKRIHQLIQETQREPFAGLGKPEPLKYEWTGYWSRRIDDTHRMVYKVEDGELIIVQLRYHY